MLNRFANLAVIVALVGSFVAIPAAPALAQGGNNPNTNRLEVPITGTATGGTVSGTFAISRFALQDGKLVAIGQLAATITDSNGANVRTIVTQVAMPAAKAPDAAAACSDEASAVQACDVLNLVLGPLHLDLLGLVIDLNQVVLNITAVPGAGNLLGNLLCAIVGLLDAPTLGQQVVNLLNQVLGILAGL